MLSLLFGVAGAALFFHKGAAGGFLDNPNHRSSHRVTTPKGAGLGFLVSFVAVAWWLETDPLFWLPLALVSFMGFVDDRMGLPALPRLVIQLIAGSVLVFGVCTCYITWWSIPAWALFMAGTANCYNFMDGIDGIAALTAVAGFSMVAYYLHLVGAFDDYVRVSLCTGAACLGFLPYNLPKARVFMGDTGSLLIGFLFGAIVCRFSLNVHEFLILVSFIFPFYCDELITMALRLKQRENLLEPHRQHIYQILANEGGFSHLSVAIFYVTIQIIVGFLMIIMHKQPAVVLFFLLTLLFLFFGVLSYSIRKKYYEKF
ncbi:WecA [Desulforapulum autotrophicum HRM2]|uniref:WecA n=1 Tax=Desulforapulum autotrophicum (strain ATCC 43914 / DSM 3382 / VKM B-1955 / HRM2) TaxID=177437 RepID=C0QK34_DESAH|nr:WecA [Desulforapulum autotrophicum HRM2]